MNELINIIIWENHRISGQNCRMSLVEYTKYYSTVLWSWLFLHDFDYFFYDFYRLVRLFTNLSSRTTMSWVLMASSQASMANQICLCFCREHSWSVSIRCVCFSISQRYHQWVWNTADSGHCYHSVDFDHLATISKQNFCKSRIETIEIVFEPVRWMSW